MEELKPILVTAIEDAQRNGITEPTGMANHILLCLRLATRLGTPPQKKTLADLELSPVSPAPVPPAVTRAASAVQEEPGESVITPQRTVVEKVVENWEPTELRARLQALFPPTVDFETADGAKMELLRRLKTLEAGDGALSFGGVEVSYLLSGAPSGPAVKIWTTESREIDIRPHIKDLIDQAKEIYRPRKRIEPKPPRVSEFRTNPADAMFGGDA